MIGSPEVQKLGNGKKDNYELRGTEFPITNYESKAATAKTLDCFGNLKQSFVSSQ